MGKIDRAYSLAEAALAHSLPKRWLHVQGVAGLAQTLCRALPTVEDVTLVEAAWLHDIGYSPDIINTGFHPLDGARYLERNGIRPRTVALVAHHSGAAIEARLRGIAGLDSYQDEDTPVRDALWYCDASTGPRGESWSPSYRWLEAQQRYGPEHLVSRFPREAEPTLRLAVDRTENLVIAVRSYTTVEDLA